LIQEVRGEKEKGPKRGERNGTNNLIATRTEGKRKARKRGCNHETVNVLIFRGTTRPHHSSEGGGEGVAPRKVQEAWEYIKERRGGTV